MKDGGDYDYIESVSCRDLVNNMTDITEEERKSMLKEFSKEDYERCPNTTYFQV